MPDSLMISRGVLKKVSRLWARVFRRRIDQESFGQPRQSRTYDELLSARRQTSLRRTDDWPPGTFFGEDSWHFHRRLLERYGMVFRPGDYSNVRKMIATNEVKLVRVVKSKGPWRRIYYVTIRNEAILISCLPGGRILTAYPPQKKLMREGRRLLREDGRRCSALLRGQHGIVMREPES